MRGTKSVVRLPVLTLVLVLAFPLTSAYAAPRRTVVYRVRAGENLWMIAKRYGTTPEQLATLNRMSVDAPIQIGRALRVPAPAAPKASAGGGRRPASPAAVVSQPATYVVQAGDSLWKIARTHHTHPTEIASLNGFSIDAPLRPGQALKIPGRLAAVTAPQLAPSTPTQSAPAPGALAQGAPATTPAVAVAPPATAPGPASAPPVSVDAQFEDGLATGLQDPQKSLQAPHAPVVVQPLPTQPPAPVAPSTPAASAVVAPARSERPLTPEERRRLTQIPSRGDQWASGMFALAKRYVGVRYRWGGTTPRGFDCSGFMQYVLARVGVSVPRTTFDMYAAGAPVPTVELRAGDLVFFQTISPGPSHAGIYLGDGRFIHASSGSGGVTITPMSQPYYQARYLGARRF